MKNKWLTYSVKFENQVLTDKLIINCLNKFWNDVVLQLNNNQYILIQFKILESSGNVKSISYVQLIKKDDLKLISDIFIEFWDIKSEEYHLIDVSGIYFTYKIMPLELKIKESKFSEHKNKLNSSNISTFKFNGYNLPCTMDFTTWGKTHFYNEFTKAIVFKLKSNSEYHIELYDTYSICTLKIDNKIILKFKDTMLDSYNLSSFKREFKNQTFIFEDGELKLKTIKRKTKFIKPIKPSIFLSEKFMTMDIETRNIDGVLYPYCVSIYDGKNLFSFYLSDFKDSNELLEASVLSIMKRKYNGYRVYIHNFSNFDSIFLLKILTNLSDEIIPIINDNKYIEIKFKFANYTLYFRDSYLLLPCSLADLAKGFEVGNKGVFPIFFVNNKIDLNYIGKIPPFESFVNLDYKDYIEYCKSFKDSDKWNLKNEAIKYCNQDVISLYQTISKFANIIFDEIRLDISKYPTISSLALGIFRCKFLGNKKIPIITGKMYNDIKKSYTGGKVEVFKPYGENIYHYDINSLYPYAMKNYPMPVGEPYFFEGNITKYENKPFGFFEVKVEAPMELNIPLLQTKIKFESRSKTVSPVGSWNGFYFSEEIYKAEEELNYKFEILRGYIFKKEYIFKEFVDYFYKMKANNSKDTPYYMIAKLILNSLYGKFGMNPFKEKHIIVRSSESFEIYNKYNVTNVINLDNKELISYLDNNIENDEDEYNYNNYFNISVPIASAVTSYGRIFMHQFISAYESNIYYTDTDSIAIDKKLDTNNVGSELGKFKLEYVSKKAIFLSPKVYYCLTNINDICKIKGFKIIKKEDVGNIIKFDDFYNLLFKDNKLLLNQEKWHKNLSTGNITISKDIYTLMVTSGKRKFIYDNNKLIDTKPLVLKNGILE